MRTFGARDAKLYVAGARQTKIRLQSTALGVVWRLPSPSD